MSKASFIQAHGLTQKQFAGRNIPRPSVAGTSDSANAMPPRKMRTLP
jgi:hypothetical protein